MGIFNALLRGVQGGRRANTISIDSSLGNVLVSGSSKRGKESVIRNYVVSALNAGEGVIIFRDIATGLSSYPLITSSSRIVCEIDCTDNCTTEQVDIFAGMSEKDINAYVIKIFDMYNEVDKKVKMSYQNYIGLMRDLMKKAGKKFKLDQLVDYSIEDMEDWNFRLCTNQIEQSRNDRFLNSIRADIRELESYFYDFSQNVVGYVFSGNKSLDTLLRNKEIIEISLDFSAKPEESQIIMSAIMDAVNRVNLSTAGKSGLRIVADGVPNEIMIGSGLSKLIKGGRNCKVAYAVADIANLAKQSNEWIDFAETYFFFRQTSNDNKEFCSAMFGEHEVAKQSHTQGTNQGSFWTRMQGRGDTTHSNTTTTSYQKERFYPPEQFASLPENECIFYSKLSGEHTLLTVF